MKRAGLKSILHLLSVLYSERQRLWCVHSFLYSIFPSFFFFLSHYLLNCSVKIFCPLSAQVLGKKTPVILPLCLWAFSEGCDKLVLAPGFCMPCRPKTSCSMEKYIRFSLLLLFCFSVRYPKGWKVKMYWWSQYVTNEMKLLVLVNEIRIDVSVLLAWWGNISFFWGQNQGMCILGIYVVLSVL